MPFERRFDGDAPRELDRGLGEWELSVMMLMPGWKPVKLGRCSVVRMLFLFFRPDGLGGSKMPWDVRERGSL